MSTALKKDTGTGERSTNVFFGSELYVEKCNINKWHLLSEGNFIMPDSVSKDELPRAHEGPRHWTDKAMSAQQTGSTSFANVLLSSLFNGVKCNTKQTAIILNLTPFHGNLELEAFNLMASKLWSGPKLHTMSATFEAPALNMARKIFKEGLLKSWQSGKSEELLGVDPNSNESYKPDPPVFVAQAKMPQLMVLQAIPNTLQVRMPQQLIDLFKQDPLKRGEVEKIIMDLEKTFGQTPLRPASGASSEVQQPQAIAPSAAFPGETLTQLVDVDKAMIQCTFPSHDPSYSFLVLKSVGDAVEPKLFVVAEKDSCVINTSVYAIAYWKGNWGKGKKDDNNNREVVCAWTSLVSDLVVLESGKGDSPPQSWAEVVLKLLEESPSAVGEISISQHKVLDKEGATEQKLTTAVTNPDNYSLEAKDCIVFKPDALKDVELRHTNVASYFSKQILESSPLLRMHWRVKYFDTCHELSPRKPLWFFATPIQLAKKGDLQRIV